MGECTVVYDACVLYPAPLRDLLMHLALAGLYRARWTDRIHDEWMENLLRNRPDLQPEQLERTRFLMNAHAPDCLITGYEALIGRLELPDSDDRHVLAAAIHGNASAIVTFNVDDFPPSCLDPFGIEPLHPDDFIRRLLDLDAPAVLRAARRHRASLKNPPKDVHAYLEALARQLLPETVARLRTFDELI
ncbi:MAG: PIN domain-containing protein [Pirellulaceae bacterium]|nr:PIN domain-containing protein [Pirellulaceae bacterium]